MKDDTSYSAAVARFLILATIVGGAMPLPQIAEAKSIPSVSAVDKIKAIKAAVGSVDPSNSSLGRQNLKPDHWGDSGRA